MKKLLTIKAQWADYMEDILDLATINSDSNDIIERRSRVMTISSFPY